MSEAYRCPVCGLKFYDHDDPRAVVAHVLDHVPGEVAKASTVGPRDLFAVAALQQLAPRLTTSESEQYMASTCEAAFRWADAMMRARGQQS